MFTKLNTYFCLFYHIGFLVRQTWLGMLGRLDRCCSQVALLPGSTSVTCKLVHAESQLPPDLLHQNLWGWFPAYCALSDSPGKENYLVQHFWKMLLEAFTVSVHMATVLENFRRKGTFFTTASLSPDRLDHQTPFEG